MRKGKVAMNPLRQLDEFGQALWLDDIHRELITGGDLQRLIEEDGLRGMTSNPAIFNKAISDSADYDEDLRALRGKGQSLEKIFEALAVKDVQMAADVFRPLFERTAGEHGFVSLEVNPHLARETAGTIDEARRLWKSVSRPNVFIKVPATREGLPAIEQLISEGMNINVTLLFGLPRYRAVADAYITGLEKRVRRGDPVDGVRSVASFFLSRIDALLDPRLEHIATQCGGNSALAKELRGEAAIASAKMAYQIYREIFGGSRWKKLADRQALPQWLLWASTSTKNPDYSELKYVEALIGPDTINTLPMETLEAYRDHGQGQPLLEENLVHARHVLEQLPKVGIDIDQATRQLEEEGIEKFRRSFDALLETLEREIPV
jgi:transaldolase